VSSSSYRLGQTSFEVDVDADVECEDDVDVDADSFVVGLGLAAWAMAVPPTMSAPETVSATSALRSWCRMIDHLLPIGAHPVKTPGLRIG
jgi:hypothetical protein